MSKDDLVACEFLLKRSSKPKLEWLQENVDVNALDVMIENLYEKRGLRKCLMRE